MQTISSLQPTSPQPHRIVIVGAAGSGKTTLAVQWADILSLPHVELDAAIQQNVASFFIRAPLPIAVY